MQTLLVVDDDPMLRRLIRTRLQGSYEIIDTGDPEEAFALALEHKPDAILLDLMMPGHSGFELCSSLHSVNYTSHIPVFIVTGEAGNKFREHCRTLGARGYFEKPIDFTLLKNTLSETFQLKQPSRRASIRAPLKLMLKLVGHDEKMNIKTAMVTTENISAGGFFCISTTPLVEREMFDVFLLGQDERYVGKARVVRKEVSTSPWQKYGFQFVEKTEDWLFH